MGLPNWVQSGGQVQAPKITGFDTAFNPILGHLQRLVDANNRKEAAEANRKFRQSEYQRNRDHSKALADASRISAKDMFDEELRIKSEIAQKEAEDRKNIRQDTSNYRDAVLAFDRDKHNDDYKLAKKKLEILENESNNTNKYSREAVAARDADILRSITLPKPSPLAERFTGKTLSVPRTEEEKKAVAKSNILKAHSEVYNVNDQYKQELKDQYGITDHIGLKKLIAKTQKEVASGKAGAKKKLTDLENKDLFFRTFYNASQEEYDKVPSHKNVDETMVDYIKSLSNYRKDFQEFEKKLYDSEASSALINRLIKQHQLANSDHVNYLRRGAERQQDIINAQIAAQLEADTNKAKTKANLNEFLNKEKIKYNASNHIFEKTPDMY